MGMSAERAMEEGRPGLRHVRTRLSIWGYLGFLIWTLVMAALAPGIRVLLVLTAAIGFSALIGASCTRLVRRLEFWFLVSSAVLLGPIFIGEKDMTVGWLHVSRQGFRAGLWMAARALTIALAFNAFSSRVSMVQMAALLERAGLRGLGFALGTALNLLPTIRRAMVDSFSAMRLRGGFRRDRLGSLRKLLITVIAGSLRRGEEVVDSAEARAFDPLRVRPRLVAADRADVVLVAVLLGGGLAILLA
jgi:energy-coupling factor transporter transmembrane protein EcfT